MKSRTPTPEIYRKTADYFLWAEAQDFTYFFTGEWKRWKRTEYTLPRLVKKGALTAVRYGHKLVYTAGSQKANNTADIEHGLMCTKSLLRFKAAREGKFISENFFRALNLGSVPEWGVIYDDILLLFEYSTADNFRRTLLMKKKVNSYQKTIPKLEAYFRKKVVVLFVFEAEHHRVKRFVEKYAKDRQFYFCDLASFQNAAIGEQLTTPIYLWQDGHRYPLTP